MPPLR